VRHGICSIAVASWHLQAMSLIPQNGFDGRNLALLERSLNAQT
jgi:hypothetical protein